MSWLIWKKQDGSGSLNCKPQISISDLFNCVCLMSFPMGLGLTRGRWFLANSRIKNIKLIWTWKNYCIFLPAACNPSERMIVLHFSQIFSSNSIVYVGILKSRSFWEWTMNVKLNHYNCITLNCRRKWNLRRHRLREFLHFWDPQTFELILIPFPIVLRST